jgi:hypothetical protein
VPYEGRWIIKKLKGIGYENCSTEHKFLFTHLNYPSLKQFSHPQQKPVSRARGLASWLS